MPRVKEQKRSKEPENIGRQEGDDECREEGITEQLGNGELGVFELYLDRYHGDVNRRKDEVSHDDDPEVDHRHVELIGTLRAIAKGENEAGEEGCQIQPFENNAEYLSGFPKQIVVAERGRQDAEHQEEVALEMSGAGGAAEAEDSQWQTRQRAC